MSQGEPAGARDDNLNPHTPGSDAWFDPTIRSLHEPDLGAHAGASSGRQAELPFWQFVLLAVPVVLAVLGTDPDASWLVRVGWLPLLVGVCAYLVWWHFARRR